MSDILDNVNAQSLDIFKEIGNIGGGNAATALAEMLNKKIDMSVPDVQIVPFNDIANILNGPENIVVGILVNMTGDLNGYILLLLEPEHAYEMASIAMGESRDIPQPFTMESFTDLDQSVILEISNILVGSYLSAIYSLTNLKIIPSVPEMAIDMVGAIISIVVIEYGKIGDSVLFLKTLFTDETKSMSGHFFLIPDLESYEILMKSLGME